MDEKLPPQIDTDICLDIPDWYDDVLECALIGLRIQIKNKLCERKQADSQMHTLGGYYFDDEYDGKPNRYKPKNRW